MTSYRIDDVITYSRPNLKAVIKEIPNDIHNIISL